jgi:hypothetical protein
MPSVGWIKTLEDGGRVKFTYQDLPGDVRHRSGRRQQAPLFDPY